MPISKVKNQRPKVLFFFSAFIVLFLIWGNSDSSRSFRTDLKQLILNELISINPPPARTIVDAVYVLGGNQKSLEFKYKLAAGIFLKGDCNKILILSRPGKTDYSLSLGRNLTNDEWSVLKLKEYNVPAKYTEAITIKEGFFGTFSEARDVSALIEKRGYKTVVLISSRDHTLRTKISFENFLTNEKVLVYVQGYGEDILLRNLITEWVKLKVYQYFLIKNNEI